MTTDEMSKSVENFFTIANALQWKKNADYHPDKIAMLEILQTAWETNITVEQDLWARIRKQMSALRRFVIEGHLESEPPRSRMIDVAVYMGMMAFWMENQQTCIHDAFNFVRDERTCENFGGKGFTQGSTCVRQGYASDLRCDRCSFLMWLSELYARPR